MGSNPSLVCVISCGVRVVPDAFLHERARASGESSLMRLSSAPCKNIGVSEHTVSSGGAAMCHRITSVTRINFLIRVRKLIRVTRIFDRFFDRISRNSTGMKPALIRRDRTWKGKRRINASRRITEISSRQKPVSLTLTGRVGQRRPLDRSTVLSKKVCSQRRTLTTTSVRDENF